MSWDTKLNLAIDSDIVFLLLSPNAAHLVNNCRNTIQIPCHSEALARGDNFFQLGLAIFSSVESTPLFSSTGELIWTGVIPRITAVEVLTYKP